MKSKIRTDKKFKRTVVVSALVALSLGYIPGSASAAEAPLDLGTASSYAVLSHTQTTSNTPSSVSGTAGVHIGTGTAAAHTGTIAGYDTEVIGGSAIAALSSASSALAVVRSGTAHVVELGGGTLNAGAYANGTFGINGVLTLDGQGATNSVFIFRTESTLITGSGSSVNLINGAQACNVYWQVGTSATLGSTSSISGHVIAGATISTDTGAIVKGQLIATTGSVTLLATTITNSACDTPVAPVTTPVAPVITPVAPVTTPVATSENPVPVVAEVAYVAPATLHLVKLVSNSHDGTATPGSFVLHITKNGVEVAGSPMTGISGNGRTYLLAPGTYNLFENPVEKYRGVWSGNITPGGTITLTSGEDLVVTRTNYDIGTTVVTPFVEVPEAPVTDATETGGELPNTASPLGNSIFLGSGLILIALIGFGSRKILARQ